MKAIQVRNENYDAKKMESVYQNLVANARNGQAQDYEIRLDDFVIVARNKDPERFLSYADYITPDTKYISVLLYRPNTNTSDKFFFHLQANSYSALNGLGGINAQQSPFETETNQKEKWRKELHYEQLLEENEQLKEQLEEYEQTIEKIHEEKETIRSNRDVGLKKLLGHFFDGAVESDFVKKNIPFINNLSGFSVPPTPTQNQEEQATFKRKGEPQDVETEDIEAQDLSEEDKFNLSIVGQIKQRVGTIDYANVMHLLDLITNNPHVIPFTIKQVSNYLKQKPTVANNNNDEQI